MLATLSSNPTQNVALKIQEVFRLEEQIARKRCELMALITSLELSRHAMERLLRCECC